MKKKFVCMLAVFVVGILMFTACAQPAAPVESGSASPEASAEETPAETGDGGGAPQYKMAFSGSELANPWVAMVKDGFEAACKDNGIEFVSLNAGSDVDQQVADVENVIESGYNALVFNPIDGTALDTVLNKATDEGIASVTIAQTADAATAGIVLDDAAYGAVIGQNAVDWINENLGGKGKVAVLAEDNIQSSIARGDAIVAAIEKGCPDVEIVARQHANTPELGLSVTENLLLQHPDLNVVVACNDTGGVGAFQAFENAGISGDDRAIFSGDKTDEAVGYMKQENSIYRGTADLHPYESGYNAVLMALEYLKSGLPAEQEQVPLEMEPITQAQILAEG